MRAIITIVRERCTEHHNNAVKRGNNNVYKDVHIQGTDD